MRRLFAFSIFVSLLLLSTHADTTTKLPDWSQWHGNDRTNVSTETGLQKAWAAQPPTVWSINGLGTGYSSVAIKDDRIFVQGGKDNQSTVLCLNRVDGKTVWTAALGRLLDQDR